jgi:hypothetical protein
VGVVLDFFERQAWKVAGLIVGVEVVEGIRFLDFRGLPQRDQVRLTLVNATDLLKSAGMEFWELVRSELAIVAAIYIPKERVLVEVRAYLSPFQGAEWWSQQFLAARLVWAATVIREYEDARRRHKTFDIAAAMRHAIDAQLRFVERLPEAEAWVDYLKTE